MTLIISWIGSVLAALAGVTLVIGSKETQASRILVIAGAFLPLIVGVIFGPGSKAFQLLLPLGLILTAAGGLLFSNIEEPKQKTTPVYAAVFVIIGGFSLAGWSIVAGS